MATVVTFIVVALPWALAGSAGSAVVRSGSEIDPFDEALRQTDDPLSQRCIE
jgi:hypothetical protein